MSNAIEVRNLHYRAGKTFELRDLNLTVPSGSIFGFLGPNGSGKTTTMQLCLGMRPATTGRITILGHDVPQDAPNALARTGYVPERPHLYPNLTVAESVRFHSAFYATWDERWAQELLDRFDLERSTVVSRLSKGEMGKLMMLLALAQQPELLMLDEPTDGLDPVARRDVLSAVLDYVSKSGASVFISSHLVHELERICDWVGILDKGSLVAELPMQSFKDGIKRLRVSGAPPEQQDTPFTILSRRAPETMAVGETWIVRDWNPEMAHYFETIGATLQDVVDLDLEEGFVELLTTSRAGGKQAL